MDIAEICPLTQDAIEALLTERCATWRHGTRQERRQTLRWPFPGTIELWVPDEDGLERHTLGTCIDLSIQGVGIRCDDALPLGLELAIAVHQPEVSFHGRAMVRHCSPTKRGDYLAGLEFLFDPSS